MAQEIKSRAGIDILKIIIFILLLLFVIWLFFLGGFYSLTGSNI